MCGTCGNYSYGCGCGSWLAGSALPFLFQITTGSEGILSEIQVACAWGFGISITQNDCPVFLVFVVAYS
jgi:hypothetical protein